MTIQKKSKKVVDAPSSKPYIGGPSKVKAPKKKDGIMVKIATSGTVSHKADTGIPVDLPCSEIFFDRSWNSRRSVADDRSDTGGSGGYPNLVRSLATRKLDGEKFPQRDPVVVRPNPMAGKLKGEPGRPFLGVSGFQRYDAILFTATGREQEQNYLRDPKEGAMSEEDLHALLDDEPTVRAFIKNLSESEARIENLAENMQRSTLSGPDVVYGLSRLWEANPEISDREAAIVLGNNSSWISKIHRIVNGTKDVVIPPGTLSVDQARPMSVLDAWRETPRAVTQNQMDEISRLEDPNAKLDAFTKLAGKPSAVTGTGEPPPAKKTGAGAWLGNAMAFDAVTMGTMLGTLQRLGVITVVSERMTEEAVRAAFAPIKKIPANAGTADGSHGVNIAKLGDALIAATKAAAKGEPIGVNAEA